MCGPAVNKVAELTGRATADVLTAGSYEGIRKLDSPIAKLPEKGASTAATLLGAKPGMPSMPAPAEAPSDSDAGPAPTVSPANPTDLAAMTNRKRLAALRLGLLSTIATSGQGVTSAPSLFTPSAFAVRMTGTKTALGQ